MWDLIVSVPDHCLFFTFKDVRWLQLFIQTFFLTSLFRFKYNNKTFNTKIAIG